MNDGAPAVRDPREFNAPGWVSRLLAMVAQWLAPLCTVASRLLPWIYIAGEAIIPLLIGALTTLIFLLLPQAQEVLFGTIGVTFEAKPLSGPPGHLVGSAFASLLAAIAAFGFAVWYCARLLVTVDTGSHHAISHDDNPRGALAQATEHLPRIFGALTAALLASAVVNAQNGFDSRELGIPVGPLLAGLAAIIPLALAVFVLHRDGRPMRAGHALVIVVGIFVQGMCLLLTLRGDADIEVTLAFAVLCYLPAVMYAVTRIRRRALSKLKKSGAAVPSPIARRPFAKSKVQLWCMSLAGLVMLFAQALTSASVARHGGSAAIILVFVTALLLLITVITLLLRRLSHKAPGAAVVLALAFIGFLALMHALTGWSPLVEAIGRGERLDPVAWAAAPAAASPPQLQSTLSMPTVPRSADIVVNAHGGGLRAATFTAQVLADLDDRSCGKFGERLDRVSGVSGGSVGIAIYFTLRQEFMASGGYGACQASFGNTRHLRALVEKALLQDHLSPVISKMLSSDVLPFFAPQRGRALLQSWNEGVLAAVTDLRTDRGNDGRISLQGLARPLHQLDGGISSPAPLIYFNTTDARYGRRLWLSNRSSWGSAMNVDGGGPLGPDMQVGEAVLHSARFPVVSPAGEIALGRSRFVVDAGYADNSGVGTLQDSESATLAKGKSRKEKNWLDVDGNPPGPADRPTAATSGEGSTAVGALLAVRVRNAYDAVRRYQEIGGSHIPLKLDLNKAFEVSIPNATKRMEFLKKMREAPLGWYMSRTTAGDQNLAILASVNAACTALGDLCGTIPPEAKASKPAAPAAQSR